MSARASPATRPRAAAVPAAANAPTAPAQHPPRHGPLDEGGLDHLVGYAASRAAIEMRKVFLRHMEPLGLKVPEYCVLMLVAHNPEVNQKRLGNALDISPPNLAVMLDRMVERGWVERVRGTRDRRAQHIHLTAAGRALATRAQRVAATMEETSLAVLSAAERALLIELLTKVYAGRAPRT